MGKKKTIEFIRGEFEARKCILNSTVYVNNSTKLDYICPNGHEHSISWKDFQQGCGCPKCADIKLAEDRKHGIGYIRGEFEKRHCILKSTEYINAFQKLDYICPNGHEHSIKWNDFQQGYGCPQCAIEKNASAKRHGIEYIKEQFEKREYILKSTEYINAHTKLEYICPNGHEHSISWHHFRQGRGCPYCSKKVKPTIESIKEQFNKNDYILKSDVYIDAHSKLDYICSNGHEHSISWTSFQQGSRCPTCANINMVGPGNPSWKGGISCDPYCDAWADKEYKESIKERDGYRCQNPYCLGKSKKLVLHHIEYDKKKCSPKDLITTCDSCNGFANKDRDWHKAWYQTIMANKHGYMY